MGRILVLDRNMINMIAAGEVIERPASVVKELLENSIDSGAKSITVSIEDGGRKLISVTDDGCGMDADDLGSAFEPHATSKIKESTDLQKISTLGFRGEALASIASVSQVRAVSRVKDSAGGNCIEIDCGDKSVVSPCSSDYGTSIQIRDLFYKLPARRKFLKTANTEAGHILECFKRIALANCDLSMTLLHNGRAIYRLNSGHGVVERIAELFSSEISENLIETKTDEKRIEVYALLGHANISKTNNKFQYVFLNGRFIRDKFISHAIKEAYRGYLEVGRFATIFLFIEMPNEDFDVNVHPTKIEVRFYNSNLLHSQILGCLREKLLATNFDVEGKMVETANRSGEIEEAMTDFFKKYRPAQSQRRFGFGSGIPSGVEVRRTDVSMAVNDSRPMTSGSKHGAFQIHDSFIIAQSKDGFVIIDQHALHERIIYENLRDRITSENLQSQKLLIPESFDVSDEQTEAIKANAELIRKLGIELVCFGPGVMAIQSFPTLLSKASPVDFVKDMVDLLMDKDLGGETDSLVDEVLNLAACKAAIKAGQKLSQQEIEQLLSDKEVTQCASRCPHGRPTTIKFSLLDLEKQFKRK